MKEKDAIPTKFHPGEKALLRVLAARTGLSVSDVVRRCVRILGQQIEERGDAWNWIQESAQPFNDEAVNREAATLPPPIKRHKPRKGQSPKEVDREATQEVAKLHQETDED